MVAVFSVSIALQYRGETIAGVVYAPYLNELFWASKGGGAYMKSRSGEVKRLHVSDKQENRKPLTIVRRAVERIDHPAPVAPGTPHRTALLAQYLAGLI